MSSEILGDLILIGHRIKYIRKKATGTQANFAKRLGISTPYVSQLEKNQYTPSEQLILSICRAFSVRREWLETGEGEKWDHGHHTTRGHQLIDEINKRLLTADLQVPLTTVAKIVNIDVDRFPEEPHKIIKFAEDDVSDLFDAFITILREGNKMKVDTIKALLYTFVPKKTPQLLTQGLLEDMAINVKERILWAKHAKSENNFIEAREEWLKAMEALRLLSTARSEEVPPDAVREYEEFLNQDPVYTNNIEKIVSIVKQNPGIQEGALYKHFQDIEKNDIFYVLRVAQYQNKISILKKGKSHRLYPY